ncbi:MAG: spermidine/putrescine ABC transporter substrate-binding protein [Candidatus Hydrogenedentota bacterium]|nr:MAG: spermidine/putrescine ABC transporter substrate-binding protein [Candidatus Hydrogenedentota bacterium]
MSLQIIDRKEKLIGFSRTLVTLSLVAFSGFFIACTQKKQAEKLSKELNVYNWSYYIGKNTIPNFEREFNVKVNYDNYSSNEELLAKLQSGAKGYDVIFPSDYMVQIMIKQKLLEPLNMKNIPNFKNIAQKFKNLPFDPNNKFSIPYLWGTTGIGINTEKVQDYVDGWDILWNMKYKGRITILDDMRFGIVPALKKLGYSINTTNPKELEEAKRLLMIQKPLVKAYTSDTYIDMLKSGDSWIAYGYSGDIYQVAKENPSIRYVIPKEGTCIWVDNMCIPKGAPHKYTAEVFINYILRPEVSAEISNETWYANPNEASYGLTNPKIINDPSIYPPKEILDKCEFLKDVGDATILYSKIWSQVKSK